MEAFYLWFQQLYESTGWNFVFMYEEYERDRLLAAMWITLKLSLYCLFFSLIVGVIGAWAQGAKSPIARNIIYWYIQAFRNTPPLVQILFFYFVLGNLLPTYDAGGYREQYIGAFGWAVVSLSFFAGAFNVEIFRAGVEAVPTATVEAAESLGYSRLKAYLYIVLPLAFRVSLPALNNNLVNLVKTTTLAYVIAVPEMMYAANQIWSDNVNVSEMMIVLFVYYVGLVAILVYFMHRWERAMRIPGYGSQ